MGGGHDITGNLAGTGGVRPMQIEGRTQMERERTMGMTPEERAWRKKWLQDQVINEPKYVKAAEKELLNPLRRFYKFPLDYVFTKFVGPFIVSCPMFL